STVRGQYGHGAPFTYILLATQAMFLRQGRIVVVLKSGIAIMSGLWGPWPISPVAKPAKPALPLAMSSRWVAGTSLALGAPLISTHEHRNNSTPLSWMSRFVSASVSIGRILLPSRTTTEDAPRTNKWEAGNHRGLQRQGPHIFGVEVMYVGFATGARQHLYFQGHRM